MDGRMHGWKMMDGWKVDGWVEGWMDGWMDGGWRTKGRVEEWMGGRGEGRKEGRKRNKARQDLCKHITTELLEFWIPVFPGHCEQWDPGALIQVSWDRIKFKVQVRH